MIRPEVQTLREMGQFPNYGDNVDEDRVWKYQHLLESIRAPLNNDEAAYLCPLFNDDDFYGLAFALRNLVETAPSWPIWEAIDSCSSEWQEILSKRAENGGYNR